MTDPTDSAAFDEDRLDGHTIEELNDYLDRGRTPPDPSIESSPECRLALASLERLRSASLSLIEDEASRLPDPGDSWTRTILDSIAREVRAGREIPIAHPSPAVELSQSEGSVRSLVRAAGDAVPGALIGRCVLQGDVTQPGDPITVEVSIVAFAAVPLPGLAGRVREAILTALRVHTELLVVGVDVTVEDVDFPSPGDGNGGRDGRG